jgi:hypothetical protein
MSILKSGAGTVIFFVQYSQDLVSSILISRYPMSEHHYW